MQSVFVTGTDTNVGIIGACIARAAGVNVGVMKPFAASDPASSEYNSHDTEIFACTSKVH